MRLYLDQFHTLIQQAAPIYPFYLLSSDEDTLLYSCQEKLCAYLTQHGFNGPIPADLFSTQLSLFSQKEILVQTLPTKPTEEFILALTQYTPPKNYQKIYVFLTNKLDKNQTNHKWVKYIDTYGAIITIWPPEGYKLNKWLSETADYFKLTLNNKQKNHIINTLPNNLADIYQLLKLLAFCFAEQPITDNILNQLLCHQPQYSESQLIHAVLTRDVNAVIKISLYLQQHKRTLLLIWWLTQLFDWWQSPVENQLGAPGTPLLKKQAQSLSIPIQTQIKLKLTQWKTQLFQIDIYAKNSQPLNTQYQLTELLLNIVATLKLGYNKPV